MSFTEQKINGITKGNSLMQRLKYLLALVVLVTVATESSAAEELIRLQTRTGVEQQFLLIKTENPVAAVVLFAGTNDIVEENPDLAEQVYKGYQEFVTRVRRALPEVFIYFVAITPTPTRWKYWSIAAETNRLIQEYTQNETQLGYIDFTEQLLGTDGKPDRSLYKFDGIHPNRKCYVIWTASIKNQLEADLSFV